MRLRILALIVLVLLVPMRGAAQGQSAQSGAGAFSGLRELIDKGSVSYLLSKSDGLQLGTQQRMKLKDIDAKWLESTKPARERVKVLLPEDVQALAMGADRQAMMALLLELLPLGQQLMLEDQKAVEEALKLLQPAQQAKAKTLLDERQQNLSKGRIGGER